MSDQDTTLRDDDMTTSLEDEGRPGAPMSDADMDDTDTADDTDTTDDADDSDSDADLDDPS